jgi:hypothetical protein
MNNQVCPGIDVDWYYKLDRIRSCRYFVIMAAFGQRHRGPVSAFVVASQAMGVLYESVKWLSGKW